MPAPLRSRSSFQTGIDMSESLRCQNSYCEGVFTISEPPDPQAVCSVCGLTWDKAARAEDLANDEAPGSHGPTEIDTEIKRWANALAVTRPLDTPDERRTLLAWYKQFDRLKSQFDKLKSQYGGPRNIKIWFDKVFELAKTDPELRNLKQHYAPGKFVDWLESHVIEANDQAWPMHDHYDEGESLHVLVKRTRQDRDLWDAFEAATRDLEHASLEFERFLRLPITWLRGIHDIEEDALDVQTKAWRANFNALFSNPDTCGFFIMGPADFRGLPISAPLYRWTSDVCAGRILCPRPRRRRLGWAPRNARIVRAIERLCELGLTATRNMDSPPYSACDAVAAVIHRKYLTVAGIWKAHRSKTASRRPR